MSKLEQLLKQHEEIVAAIEAEKTKGRLGVLTIVGGLCKEFRRKLQLLNACILLLSLFICSSAAANSLVGLKEVGVLVESLGEDAKRCNLSEDLIDASVRLPLSNSRIKIVKMETAPDSYLYVNVNIIEDGAFCILNVVVAHQKYMNIEREYGQFWSRARLMSQRKTDVSTKITEFVESSTKIFISSWLKAN